MKGFSTFHSTVRYVIGLRKGAHGAGEYQLPGGHLEFFEGFEECCAREVEEETGLLIENIWPIAFTNDMFPDDGLHYVTLYFHSDWVSGKPERREPKRCGGWIWRALEDFPDRMFVGTLHVRDILLAQKL